MKESGYSFNLKRDASPVATLFFVVSLCKDYRFQSQARCQPRGDPVPAYRSKKERAFQSQARCQPRGDCVYCCVTLSRQRVSISSEMPAPWRLQALVCRGSLVRSFNLKRDASPVATWRWCSRSSRLRDVSISSEMPAPWRHGCQERQERDIDKFQSQARCQPRGDASCSSLYPGRFNGFNLKRDASPVATPDA